MHEPLSEFNPECLEPGWRAVLGEEFQQDYMRELRRYLSQRYAAGATVYPIEEDWFNAFRLTPFDQVKTVILGQDPYHGPGQAHGLCFSVQRSVTPPPSLKNIYRELQNDLGVAPPSHGCLESWARQGVLLLNSVLTVEEGKAGAHQRRGWERFTDKVIELLNARRQRLVFMLWGSHAQQKGGIVDRDAHCVLESVHPSPLSAYRGFFGCRHFSRANDYLDRYTQGAVDWRLD
jgi:uracil-DNA glycosylase